MADEKDRPAPPDLSTLRIAADILTAAIQAKALTLLPDPKARQSTSEHDSAQIARAFMTIHEAVVNEAKRR